MDENRVKKYLDEYWEHEIIPTLSKLVEIRSVSPTLDPKWIEHGEVKKAVEFFKEWAESQSINGLKCEILQLEGRAPFIFLTIEGSKPGKILTYGHLDVQPEGQGWSEDLDPWKATRRGDTLYGRGVTDNKYGPLMTVAIFKALQHFDIPHASLVQCIEMTEEGGSEDVGPYLEVVHDKIHDADFVIIPDSSPEDYDRMWHTSSLRGVVMFNLTIQTLPVQGHSGYLAGVVPPVLDILSLLMDRLYDKKTGDIVFEPLIADIPEHVKKDIRVSAKIAGEQFVDKLAVIEGYRPYKSNVEEIMLQNTRMSGVEIDSLEGYPDMDGTTSAFFPKLTLRLRVRVAPGVDAKKASDAVATELTRDPPFGAKVTCEKLDAADAWSAPEPTEKFLEAFKEASQKYYGNEPASLGCGAGIPAIYMLKEHLSNHNTQWLVTGMIGPGSNIHGPDENLRIDVAKKLTGAITHMIERFSED